VATIERRGRFLVAEPLFDRGPRINIDRRSRGRDGAIALVETGPGRGKVVRELGSPARARDVVEALIWQRCGWRGFRAAVEREADRAAEVAEAGSVPRRDLSELATFTVDPATARDFDDAVSARREGDGVRLWIHIADVAAHVRPGSELDREASRRANSTYVPGTVEPMLPTVLSAGACSLAPNVERLAVTTEIELAGGGEVRTASFYRSRIRSDARLDYDQLDEIFAGRARPPEAVAEPAADAEATPEPEVVADVAPEFAAPPGVEAVRRHTAKGTTLLFLLNHRDEPIPISVAAGSRDLLGGSPVGADGIRLGPRDVVVLEEAGNLPAETPEAG